MRLIYVDEAGTAPRERFRIVSSIIVDADGQYRTLERELIRVFDEHVPKQIRENFSFHATEVFSGGKKGAWHEFWAFEERLDFLKEVVSLPFVHDVPVGLGVVGNGSFPNVDVETLNVRPSAFEHAAAFAKCLERSDWFLRGFLRGEEVGVVVAEDVQEKRRLLRTAGLVYRNNPQTVTADLLVPPTDESRDILKDVRLEITQIIDVPHFVEKGHAPLLQLVDAVAFSFRRYISSFGRGDELIYAMLGPAQGRQFINDKNWLSGASSGLFNTWSYQDEETKRQIIEINRNKFIARQIADVILDALDDSKPSL